MTYKEFIDFCKTKNPTFSIEVHHIEPLSIGGVDVTANKIALSAKDHYNAHKLLALEHPYNLKLWQAWWQVYITRNIDNPKDYLLLTKRLSSLPILRSEECKKNKSIATKQWMNSLTPEEKKNWADKISKANKKVYQNEEVRKRVSDGLKKKWQEPEYREKCLMRMVGRKGTLHTQEFKDKLSESHKGTKWFTNGIKNVLAFECPEGYKPGITRGLTKNV